MWDLLHLTQTYNLDSVSRHGCDVPGALLAAGILVWPVGAAQGPTGAVYLVLTLSWIHTETHKHTHRRKLKIVAAQEKVKGNGKGTGRKERNKRTKRENGFQRNTFTRLHSVLYSLQ